MVTRFLFHGFTRFLFHGFTRSLFQVFVSGLCFMVCERSLFYGLLKVFVVRFVVRFVEGLCFMVCCGLLRGLLKVFVLWFVEGVFYKVFVEGVVAVCCAVRCACPKQLVPIPWIYTLLCIST